MALDLLSTMRYQRLGMLALAAGFLVAITLDFSLVPLAFRRAKSGGTAPVRLDLYLAASAN